MPDLRLLSRQTTQRSVWKYGTMLLAVWAAGCSDRSDQTNRSGAAKPQPEAVQNASYGDRSARQFLTAVFVRYRNAATYHDSARVRLSFETDGRPESRVAPLSVWFEHRVLKIEAYDVRLWSDQKSVSAWINDPSIDHFDSQVLRMPPIDGRPNLQSLLSDPILADRLGAGLAGPPPQLEWLFAAEPMKYLFDPGHRVEFGERKTIEGSPCLSIRVDAAAQRYLFWIDEHEGLIRQVDFPPIAASSAAAEPSASMTLRLELVGASFDVPQRTPSLDAFPKRPKWVRSFVPLPPEAPSRQLGTRAQSFRRSDIGSTFEISEQGSDRPITLLMGYSGDKMSVDSAGLLERWAAMMPQPLRGRLRIILATAEDPSRSKRHHPALSTVVDRNGVIAQRYALVPGSLTVLGQGGKIVWVQDELNPPNLVALGSIVADVLGGVDVPKRLREQWNESVKAYESRLNEQRFPVK